MKALAGNRVLFVTENSTYPNDVRVRSEAETLVNAGCCVSVISNRRSKQPWRDTIDGVHVFRYPAPPEAHNQLGYLWEYGYSLAAAFVMSLLVSWRPGFDVLHAANPPDTIVFLALFYKLFGKRFVFDHHDLAPEAYEARFSKGGNRIVYQILTWLEKISCRVADHVIAPNESYKSIEMQRGGVPKERITVVRNGPALDRLVLVEPDAELRAMGKVIICWVGGMAPQDGMDYLLRALQLLRTMGRDDFYCVVIGKGVMLGEMKALATKLGLDEYVRFTGYVPHADKIRYLSTADICVDPDPSNSLNDRSTMIKMMEYMALGKPIVAFDLPEHRVTAQEAALYARPNDELDFARHIAVLMDDPERRKEMGRVGRERVENELAWPHQARHLLDAYASIAANRHLVG